MLIMAGLAALTITFGLGAYIARVPELGADRFPSYSHATAAMSGMQSGTPGGSIPCENPSSKEESDLCAQWRAAKAAEDGAAWTRWGVIVGILGSALLLWQIVLTRRAVEDTGYATDAMREANRIAAQALNTSQRPWVALDGAQFIKGTVFRSARDPHRNPIDPINRVNINFSLTLENLGNVPALDVKIFCSLLPRNTYPGDFSPPDQTRADWTYIDAIIPQKDDTRHYEVKGIVQDELWGDWRFWLIVYCAYVSPATGESLETVRHWRIMRSAPDRGGIGDGFSNDTLPGRGEFTGAICSAETIRMT
ncbi:hypothetical protein [Novosphingobium sp. JCM 18896]|uniref:hypothetical protein n=1 Tax=Novosphingobium sp. JCM 18896 TaxID=2989731 RepID=UPI002222B6D0|nr:hypothetical protein [Novosphingobium sp. JCM 18896]MCW1432428.1 hypothetical protein [Novosphingobium sp. JCM 18896]